MTLLRVCPNCRTGLCAYCCSATCAHGHYVAGAHPIRRTPKCIAITVNQARVLVLLQDSHRYPFEIMDHNDVRALKALKRKGWVTTKAQVSLSPYTLTQRGNFAANLCRAELYPTEKVTK